MLEIHKAHEGHSIPNQQKNFRPSWIWHRHGHSKIFGMFIKFSFRWYIIYYNYSKGKVKPQNVAFPLMLIFSKKDILIAFIFCSNIVLMTIFHDSKFEVGMTRVVATYVILIDVYML